MPPSLNVVAFPVSPKPSRAREGAVAALAGLIIAGRAAASFARGAVLPLVYALAGIGAAYFVGRIRCPQDDRRML